MYKIADGHIEVRRAATPVGYLGEWIDGQNVLQRSVCQQCEVTQHTFITFHNTSSETNEYKFLQSMLAVSIS